MAELQDLLDSVRQQIPDVGAGAFSDASLILWVNEAGRLIAQTAPVIQDWYAVNTVQGMDVYTLPNYIATVEQAFYDLIPLQRDPELKHIFTAKITARSWWFGPHAIHANPVLHVWPACSRTGLQTTLSATFSSVATQMTLTSVSGLMPMGYIFVGAELVLYRNVDSTTKIVSNLLRAQGGTVAVASASSGTSVKEGNLFFKCFRLPKKVLAASDTFELPQGLWPLVELWVIAKVREAEQDHKTAQSLRQEFFQLTDVLTQKGAIKGIRQGIQVITQVPGPELYYGRVYVP